MMLEECFSYIDHYLNNMNDHFPRFINIESLDDMHKLLQHYQVGSNIFLKVSDYSAQDESMRTTDLLHDLSTRTGNIFLQGFTTQWKLEGKAELSAQIKNIINMNVVGHVIVLCYQCKTFLEFKDPRLNRLIYDVAGAPTSKTQTIVFMKSTLRVPANVPSINGINRIAETIESQKISVLYVKTQRDSSFYPRSMYKIIDESSAYDRLCRIDELTNKLLKKWGTEEQWSYVLSHMREQQGWQSFINSEFNFKVDITQHLEIFFQYIVNSDDTKKWLYFIAVKLFGIRNNWCLSYAIDKSECYEQIAHWVLRSILSLDSQNKDYWKKYDLRKDLLKQLVIAEGEVLDYCKVVRSKGRYAIRYLTDIFPVEKETIIECLAQNAKIYSRNEVEETLKHIYPDLNAYLSAYHFNNDLLDSYFSEYKFCKLMNMISPNLDALVEDQATKREFNLLLPSRSEKIETAISEKTHAYFMDAMGVEFLGFIVEKSRQKNLHIKITVCKSELPSLTPFNKEFLEVFRDHNVTCTSIKKLDDIKHHGVENFTLEHSPYPIHLIRELEIIDHVLDLIKNELSKGIYDKAIMIADHGASRLAIIKNSKLNIDVNSKGIHGGRVCEYTEKTKNIPFAIHANDFYVLANYNRFKGGKLMGVEVHGGATLEEVTVPIIEFTYIPGKIEITVLTPVITVKLKQLALVQFISNIKLSNISVCVSGNRYQAKKIDDYTFSIELPKRIRAGTYSADVYESGALVAKGLPFKIEKEGFKQNYIL